MQQALDQYEAGDPTVLEHMIRSGALQNKAVPDLDLLGDLDLDFLTVNDNMIGEDELGHHREGPGMYTLPQQPPAPPPHPGAPRSASLPSVMHPPPSFPSKRQASDATHNRAAANSSLASPEFDDGIGELEFTGGFDDGDGGGYYGATTPDQQTVAMAEDPPQQFNWYGGFTFSVYGF